MIQFDDVNFYQFGFYIPGYRVEPEPKIIAKLLKSFDGTDFVPNIIQEVQIGPVAETRQQLQLVTKKMEWSIEFEPHRISFIKKNVVGVDIGTPQDFVKAVCDFCMRLSNIISINANRLSYVANGILPEMKSDDLERVGTNLLTLPKFYVENLPIEWTTRNITRYEVTLNDVPETLNVITDINRVVGTRQEKMMTTKLDRIEIGFDINTFQKNKEQRFKLNDSEAFMQEAIKISQRLSDEIEKVIL